MKVNSDAAMLGDGVVGVGAVIRDAHRVVLLAGVRRFKARWLVETRATKFGMELARRFGYEDVEWEDDAYNL